CITWLRLAMNDQPKQVSEQRGNRLLAIGVRGARRQFDGEIVLLTGQSSAAVEQAQPPIEHRENGPLNTGILSGYVCTILHRGPAVKSVALRQRPRAASRDFINRLVRYDYLRFRAQVGQPV